jgi:AraC-like DNA-binding protein
VAEADHRLVVELPVEDGIVPLHVVEEGAVLDERVTLTGLARALGYSPSHVSSVVRRLTGQRFTALRRAIRLERVRWLLGRGATVKEAGLGAGFSDAAYFSRVFRRAYGVPPSRWREAFLQHAG